MRYEKINLIPDTKLCETENGEDCGCCEPERLILPRRQFLQLAGGGLLATSLGRSGSVMAGPFDGTDTQDGHLVPADKRLDDAWVKSLFERGAKEVFRGKALENIAMPCGGIGTGQLYLCGDGTLGCRQIFNNAVSNWVGDTHSTYTHKGIAKPVDQGFAVLTREENSPPKAKALNRNDFGEVEFQGEYPIGTVRYPDPEFPVKVEMEAFSPFIPLNAKDSALPATLFHITTTNTSQKTQQVKTIGWLQNAVCLEYGKQYRGLRKTRIVRRGARISALHSAEELPPEQIPTPKPVRPAILFEDFEKDGYGDWKVEGAAFGEKPATGTLTGQQKVTGFEGKGLVNTFLDGDTPHGTLKSPSFEISRRYINFLIGGGNHSEKTCINLVVEGETVRTATGRNRERLDWHGWDVDELEGKEAHLEIVDKSSAGWGHINIDQIEFADERREGEPIPMEKSRDFGTMTLTCLEGEEVDSEEASSIPGLTSSESVIGGETVYDIKDKRVGLIASQEATLEPGERHTYTFALSWSFPNQAGGHEYENRFQNAAEVANYALDNHDRLTEDTRLWRDTYYDSTLPFWLLDRLHSTVSYLSTGTCQWWKNGRFWAYEGVCCCEGTCTHVWNYAHAHARLFPELARSIREMQDFCPRDKGGGFHPDTGLVGFRSNDRYAADGQCGTILKAYREHLTSADQSFLERNWPAIKKALQHSIGHDSNADGLIEDSQHNTYDINYHGANTFVGSLYLAALRAGEEMAKEVGDHTFAKVARAIFESGRELTMERLWNGEYFIQDVDLKEHPKHQYNNGCLSDHLFGQGWAHQLALGYIYPNENVRKSLESVWKYNWAPDISPYNEKYKPFRWFISSGQAGLFTCTWPQGGYIPEGTLYKNEVWTGIEYQVAGHMIAEGMVEEGLAICRAVHDRYHPDLMNPYNEVECGDHYARALASWGVFVSLAGFEYHGPNGHIGFAPRVSPEDFKTAFTAAEGWGTYKQTRNAREQVAMLQLKWGRLRLQSLAFELSEVSKPLSATVLDNGDEIPVSIEVVGGFVKIQLEREIVLERGDELRVSIKS